MVLSRFITPGIAFLATLAFGIWLSRSGKPYNGVLFNVHKLVALGVVILTVVQLVKGVQGSEIQILPVLFIILTGLCVLALFATGALMSMDKFDYRLLLAVHNVAPIVALIAFAFTIYLLRPGTAP